VASEDFPQRLTHYESLLPEAIRQQIDSRATGCPHHYPTLFENLVSAPRRVANAKVNANG
jgi:hypothetical protein